MPEQFLNPRKCWLFIFSSSQTQYLNSSWYYSLLNRISYLIAWLYHRFRLHRSLHWLKYCGCQFFDQSIYCRCFYDYCPVKAANLNYFPCPQARQRWGSFDWISRSPRPRPPESPPSAGPAGYGQGSTFWCVHLFFPASPSVLSLTIQALPHPALVA